MLAKELNLKHQEADSLKGVIQQREVELGNATNGIERLGMREDRLLKEIELLRRENKILEDQTVQLRSDLQKSIYSRHSESYLLLENDNMKEDISRLVKMLQNTKEYKNFADYADASGSIHYLKSVGKFSRLDLAERFHDLNNARDCTKHELYVDEKVLWVPQEAYRFAHEFRLKYNGNLTESLIEHLLFELNKIWAHREKSLLATVKSSYNGETEYLRRKIANTPSLELNQLQAEVKRLRKDLKNSYKDNRDLHINRPEVNPPGMQYIKGALKMANEYGCNKSKLDKQNRYYKDFTEAYQKALNEDYRGNIYLAEGTKLARRLRNYLDSKNSINASSLKHEVAHIIQEFENKSLAAGGSGSKADLQKSDHLRDQYMVDLLYNRP